MNSQDKPIEAYDNLDESLNSDAIQENENSCDLWTEQNEDDEVTTEFIFADEVSDDAEMPEYSSNDDFDEPEDKQDISLDLDDWDFRNLPIENSADSLDTELETVNNLATPLQEGSLELESATPASTEILEGLDGSDLELSSQPNLEALELDGLEDLAITDELNGSDLELSSQPDLEALELDGLEDLAIIDELDGSDLELSSQPNLEALELDGLEDLAIIDELDGSDLELSSQPNLEALELDGLDKFEDDFDSLLSLSSDDAREISIAESTADDESMSKELNFDLDSLLEEPPTTPEIAVAPSIPTPPLRAKAPARATAPGNKAQAFDQTMRVSVRKLDELNNLIGELVVKRNRLEEDQERLRTFLDNLLGHVQSLGEAGAKMHDMYERSLLEGALMASRQSRAAVGASLSDSESHKEGLDALEMDRFTGFHLLSQEIIELIVRVREAASDIQFVVDESDKVTQTFRQVTSQLQDGMNSSRMVAFGQTADRLPRAVRDISRQQKKQTKLHVEGKDVLIDKMIVEHLYNPMTHLVNNAISHGIEKPEERLKKSKSEVGNIYIRAFIQGNQTVISVKDDGAGIDPQKVKDKAIEKNLITWATSQNMTDQQVYELLFHPGFSTKDQADDFAGRGVGMDVVNTDLKKIRGSISTESELGKGTTFTIRLPLVLSICKALICVDDNSKVAFPIDGIEDTKEYLPGDIQTNKNGVRCISWKNTLLPLRPLNSLLNYNRQIRRAGIYNANQNNEDTIAVIILRSMDNLLAIEVDEVRAEQEIVIKQIDGPVPKPPGIAGATVLGDGTIMPIGDVLELMEIAQGKRTIEIGFDILARQGAGKQTQIENVQQEPMVLVVDDSITVRELLSMSFNKLGYRVEQARDGQEAWDKLRGGLVCDMIFSDIEMPRMNGLKLLSNLHQDENLKSIPVAMLTSRGADKHKKIANDLGAKAYLTKPYTEKDLMDVAQHLIEINRANKEAESATVSVDRVKNRSSSADLPDVPVVLIIDDSITVRELLSMSFKKAGYRVEQARDGQEAWEKLSDGLDCDLAFCDIEMPRMNGLELLSQLQKDEKLAKLPIAMLTSRGARKMRSIAASRGANGYFVKPYVEDELLKAAKRMMNGEILLENIDEEA